MNNQQKMVRLIQGDLVEIRSADEILSTLDDNGTLHGLPFMHEMLKFVGQRVRVHRRVEYFSFDGDELCGDEPSVRAFPHDDVVILENARCSGVAHGGCKRGCSIFWKESWLRRVSEESESAVAGNVSELERRLQSIDVNHSEVFFCQSSELLKTTRPLRWRERLGRCLRNVYTGNVSLWEMIRNIAVWIKVRGRERLFGVYPTGRLQKTPTEVLNLQVGEMVEVKSLKEIVQTLDSRGWNRGLHFAPEMIPYCGRKMRVACRADSMIREGTGEMRSMKNTVILEDCVCDSATWAFGGCPREDYVYWREIWLRRVP
jgi:hypothetical protein